MHELALLTGSFCGNLMIPPIRGYLLLNYNSAFLLCKVFFIVGTEKVIFVLFCSLFFFIINTFWLQTVTNA